VSAEVNAPLSSVQDFIEDSLEFDQIEEMDQGQESRTDPNYNPSETDCDTDSNVSDSEEQDSINADPVPQNPADKRKFLVFESSLMELFVRCPKPTCVAKVLTVKKSLSGSRLTAVPKQTEMSSIIDGIRQAQCLAVADPAVSCSRSGGRQRRNSGHQNGYRSSGRCMCPRRPNKVAAKLVRGSQAAIVSKVGRQLKFNVLLEQSVPI